MTKKHTVHLILLDFFTLTTPHTYIYFISFHKSKQMDMKVVKNTGQGIRIMKLLTQLPIISSLMDPNILFSTLFSHTASVLLISETILQP
jgi:hypothetical protein